MAHIGQKLRFRLARSLCSFFFFVEISLYRFIDSPIDQESRTLGYDESAVDKGPDPRMILSSEMVVHHGRSKGPNDPMIDYDRDEC